MSPSTKLDGGRNKEGVSDADPSPGSEVLVSSETIPGPIDLPTQLHDVQHTQNSSGLEIPVHSNNRDVLSIGGIPHGSLVYEPSLNPVVSPEMMTGINWLSPGQTILQEWGSQLAQITENEFFPPVFNMMDLPEIPSLFSTVTEQEAVPRNPGQLDSDPTPLGSWEDAENNSEVTGSNSPEVLLDALSTDTPGSVESKYYVHVVGSRTPFQRKSRSTWTAPEGLTLPDLSTSASITSSTPSSVNHWLTPEVYARVVVSIQEHMNGQWEIPPLEYFQHCVHLYFDRLHPNFPFINKTTLLTTDSHWVLLTAVAGVGAAYLQSPPGPQWKTSLMEIVETTLAIHLVRYQNASQATDSMHRSDMHITPELVDELIPLIQAKILHMLFMLHSSSLYILRRVGFERAELAHWCSYLNLLPLPSEPLSPLIDAIDVQLWVKTQSRLRAGMMIWVSAKIKS
ncbi:hypothetical protein N7462_011481 [Penicillium macrosclerotiorum]|uniref:uncharacterized protein n=1 Tax=Penicillium macrosclerotiorum TaxID=303699 RepID=UPI0025466C46|nr:uncharacterized protein N7462_011481 [Penicillium macrosclerotiorum]KAJ5664668.1 hypothetical protein N7462_011481 [Penicillium macrosclerotiorum]